jgi:Flp pilus assembly protein CpaB
VELVHDDLPGSLAGRRVWRIGCGDVINRQRSLTVLVDKNQVVLVGPPGETAILSRAQLGQLRVALREAAEQAERRR